MTLNEDAETSTKKRRNGDIINKNDYGLHELKKEVYEKNDKRQNFNESLLTQLFEIPHFRSIYHMFIAILILAFIGSISIDLTDSGNVISGFRLMKIGFGKLHISAITWTCMQFIAVLFFYTFKMWAVFRKLIKSEYLRIYDGTWILVYIAFQILFEVWTSLVVIQYDLPPASGYIITLETVRMMMKFHSFMITVSSKFNQKSLDINNFPPLSSFIFYLFAPILLYKDTYKRSNHRSWKKVLFHFSEVGMCILMLNFIYDKYIATHWETYGLKPETTNAKYITRAFASCVIPSFFLMMCCFYMLLHSWQNAFAEMLRFSDKGFYSDWWNQKGYGSFYRTWNIVVQDWLYVYIYKDAKNLTKSGKVASFIVIFVSALFHEIIMAVTLRFFYPIMSLNFLIPGYIFIILEKYMNSQTGNVFLWWSWILGDGLIWSTYTIEYFARYHCPSTVDNKILDIFIPRSWYC